MSRLIYYLLFLNYTVDFLIWSLVISIFRIIICLSEEGRCMDRKGTGQELGMNIKRKHLEKIKKVDCAGVGNRTDYINRIKALD
jgi:hypothetical protein